MWFGLGVLGWFALNGKKLIEGYRMLFEQGAGAIVTRRP